MHFDGALFVVMQIHRAVLLLLAYPQQASIDSLQFALAQLALLAERLANVERAKAWVHLMDIDFWFFLHCPYRNTLELLLCTIPHFPHFKPRHPLGQGLFSKVLAPFCGLLRISKFGKFGLGQPKRAGRLDGGFQVIAAAVHVGLLQ